jgi:hypothetical protein
VFGPDGAVGPVDRAGPFRGDGDAAGDDDGDTRPEARAGEGEAESAGAGTGGVVADGVVAADIGADQRNAATPDAPPSQAPAGVVQRTW